MDGVELAIKPHTRSGNEVDIFSSVEANLWEDVSSVELCEWADVVLVIASSIMLEALIQGKPVLYLKYLHANTTIYEDRGACWPIHSDDELMAALSAIRDGRATLPYSTASAQEFIDDVVYRGESGSDILQLYVDFITRAAS
jgi:hypothetical protein